MGAKWLLLAAVWSMSLDIAIELGYLKVADGVLIDIAEINNYPPNRLVILTTGSQGEPMSALTRMAMSDHRKS